VAVVESSTASDDAPASKASILAVQAGSVQAALDEAATAYDRVDAPAGGKTVIGAAAIAAVQAAFDRIGDDASSR
jgi:hypothetical protein